MGGLNAPRPISALIRRPSPDIPGARPTALQRRLQAFLQALGRRYSRWLAGRPGLELVLRRPPVTLHILRQRCELLWAPRLQLTIVAPDGPHPFGAGFPAPARPAEGLPPAGPSGPAGPRSERFDRSLGPAEEQQPAQLSAAVRTETIVHRLVRRTERVEMSLLTGLGRAETARDAVLRKVPVPPPGLPVPRVVLRPKSPLLAPAAEARSCGPAGGENLPLSSKDWPAWTRSPAPGGQPAPPPIDLTRLTDQVIQAIDRRIIAQRERLGRV